MSASVRFLCAPDWRRIFHSTTLVRTTIAPMVSYRGIRSGIDRGVCLAILGLFDLRTVSSSMAGLLTSPARPTNPRSQSGLDLLSLSRRYTLTVSFFNSIDDLLYSRIVGDFKQLRHRI